MAADLGAVGTAKASTAARMLASSRDGRRSRARAVGACGLSIAFLAFAYANFASWRHTGHPAGLGATALEAWAAMLFLVRRRATIVSVNWLAWVAAPIGSFAMLLARPSGGSTLQVILGEAMQFAGVAIAFASLVTLRRSFGLVAAHREVKTQGIYRLVRHPAYAGYFVVYCGYVLENPSIRNAVLLVLSTAFQMLRILEEERILQHVPAYRDYCHNVRYRIVPLIY